MRSPLNLKNPIAALLPQIAWMKFFKTFKTIILFLCICSLNASGKIMTAMCESPKGRGFNYFSNKGTSNVKENRFNDYPDGITGAHPFIRWDTNKKSAVFVLLDPNHAHGSGKSGEIVPVYVDEDQLTFIGNAYGAPAMFTIYPREGIGFYTQHASYRALVTGAKAFMMYMKCEISWE